MMVRSITGRTGAHLLGGGVRTRGVTSLLVPVFLVLTLTAALAVGGVGRGVRDGARAQAGADASALAAVTGGEHAAQAVAAANGAAVVDLGVRGDTVTVMIERKGVRRQAAAAPRVLRDPFG